MAKLVIFEGVDGSGKTSLYQAFRRATNYQILTIERFIGSQVAYDQAMKREKAPSANYWLAEETGIIRAFDCCLFVLTAPPEVLEARIRAKEAGKDLQIALASFPSADQAFRKYWEESHIPKKFLLNTDMDPKSCLETVLKLVELKIHPSADPPVIKGILGMQL